MQNLGSPTTSESPESAHRAAVDPSPPSLAGAMLLSLALGISILAALIVVVGPWDVLAMTRLLDLLIEGGFIQYHDRNPGFIEGLPSVEYYFMSQDPVDFRLLALAAVLFLIYPSLKALQFHRIARAYGSSGSLGQHLRAYYYGDALDRFLPFNMGRVAVAQILVRENLLSAERAGGAVFLSQLFTVFEIVAFAAIGLAVLGWTDWLTQIFWALAVLAVAIYLVRSPAGRRGVLPPLGTVWREGGRAFAVLGRTAPGTLVTLCVLSLLAFSTVELAVYLTLNAFDTAVVLMAVEPPVLLMGVVGGYLAARLVAVTPGGIGQWELGFATGLYLGAADVSLSLFLVALLSNLLRILTSLSLYAFVTIRFDVPTQIGDVYAAFKRGVLQSPS